MSMTIGSAQHLARQTPVRQIRLLASTVMAVNTNRHDTIVKYSFTGTT